MKYIRELLKIMTDEKEILADDDVEGFSIRIAWVSELEPLSPSRYVDGFIVRASKSDAYNYSHKLIATQDFLSKSDVFQSSQNMSMKKLNIKVASLLKTSVAHVSPLSGSGTAGTLDKDAEVIIHSYENGFFGFSDNSAFVSKENFIITGFLRSLTGEHENEKLDLEIANKKNELESEKNWVKSLAVNVRESNTTSSPVIDKLRRGDYVFIQEEDNNWYRVYYFEPNGARRFNTVSELAAAYKKGWIYKDLLSSIRTDRLPIDQKHSISVVVEAQTGNIEYYIQVGAWKYPDNAQEILLKLKRYYPEAYITVNKNFHKIRIPGIMNKKQGANISKDIVGKFNLEPFMVRKIK